MSSRLAGIVGSTHTFQGYPSDGGSFLPPEFASNLLVD